MGQIILYTCLGSLFPMAWVALWFMDRGKTYKPEWVIEPTSWKSRLFVSAFLVVVFVGGIGMVYGVVGGTQDFVHEYQTIQQLEERGSLATVPLIEITVDDTGKNTHYDAVYEYQGQRRKQEITEDQYNALKNQTRIDIIVYEDMSRIVGTKPEYDTIVFIIMMGTTGLLMIWFPLYICFSLIKYIRQHSELKRKKHKPAKTKKRAPEEL